MLRALSYKLAMYDVDKALQKMLFSKLQSTREPPPHSTTIWIDTFTEHGTICNTEVYNSKPILYQYVQMEREAYKSIARRKEKKRKRESIKA